MRIKEVHLLFTLFFSFLCFGNTIPSDTTFIKIKKELLLAEKNANPRDIAQKNLELGNYYYSSGLFTDAINQYNEGLKILESEAIKDSLYTDTNNKIGAAYLSLNNYDSAKSFLDTAEKSAIETDYTKGKAIAKSLLGSFYEKKADYFKAMQYEKESLELFKLLNNKFWVAKSYENIGSIYEDLNQFNKAYDYFNKSYAILKNTHSFNEVNVLNNIGDVYRKKGNYIPAITYTTKALEIAKKLNNYNLLRSAYKDLAKTYALTNNYQKAYDFRILSEEYKEKALEHQNASKLATLYAEHEVDKKESEITLLKQQNKVNNANKNLMLVALVSLLLIAGIFLYYFNKRRKTTQKIQTYKQRLLKAELQQKQAQEKTLQQNIKLKTASLSQYSLSLSQKNKLLSKVAFKLKNLSKRENVDFKKKLKEIYKDIEFSLKQDNESDEFNSLFSEVHPDFSKKVSEIAIKKLTSSEIKLAMLLRLNLSSKEIAGILKVTPDSVRVARYRLRKKLPIDSKKELVSFMLEV